MIVVIAVDCTDIVNHTMIVKKLYLSVTLFLLDLGTNSIGYLPNWFFKINVYDKRNYRFK